MIQLQIYVDERLDALIRRESARLMQSRSSYARTLLVKALEVEFAGTAKKDEPKAVEYEQR